MFRTRTSKVEVGNLPSENPVATEQSHVNVFVFVELRTTKIHSHGSLDRPALPIVLISETVYGSSTTQQRDTLFNIAAAH